MLSLPHSISRWFAPAAVLLLVACGGDGPTGDSRDPRVTSITPSRNATKVAQTITVSATFSESIDPASVNGSTLTVTGGQFGSPLQGTVAVDGRVMTFTPKRAFALATTYSARVAAGVMDLAGNAMSASFTWTFTTTANPPPEHVPALVQVGVTVDGERIESGGDVDEFNVRGTAGAEWVVFAKSGPGETGSILLTVRDSLSGDLVAEVTTHSRTTELEEWSTGRFKLPRAGPYVIRVTGNEEADYAFRVDPVHRAPELAPAIYTIRDTVTEAIGTVADIDEFTYQGIAGQEVSISLQLLAPMAGELSLEVMSGDYRHVTVATRTATEHLDDYGSARMTLPTTGPYTIRVFGPAYGARSQSTGTYRFAIYPIDRRPENGAVVRLDAPPISGALDRPGDVDEYEVTGTAGQIVVLNLTSSGIRGAGELVARLFAADGTEYAAVATRSFEAGGLNVYSRRVALPHTGTYRLRVQSLDEWRLTNGPYTLEAYTISSEPEHVPSRIALGESVTAERIDRPGDIDVFTFVGEAGREVNLFLGWTETNAELYAYAGFGIFTRPGTLALDGQSTGRFMVKDSIYTVTVDPQSAAQTHMMHSQGAYAFRVFPIDPRPETRPSAYVFGDTVSAEVLYPVGDIDEYSFELTETTTLEILWEAVPNSDHVWGLLIGEKVPDTAIWAGFATSGAQVQRVTLPPDRYRLSVRSPNADRGSGGIRTGPVTLRYRFAISRITMR